METSIRLATDADITILAALGTTTCYEAYFELDPSRDLADYCARVYSSESVRAEFEDPNSTYLVAEINDRAVGFSKLRENNRVDCVTDELSIEIQRIYLLEKVKGSGVGRKLIEQCFEVGRENGHRTAWLSVWDENEKAQRFYEKIGMKNVGTTSFNDGKNDFVNYVFAIEL